MAELRDSVRHGVRKPGVAWEGGGPDGGDGGRRWEESGDKIKFGSEPRCGNVGRGRIRRGGKVRIASKCCVNCFPALPYLQAYV